ncbi:MAG: hypothetical protein R3B12_00790 [Candidatus Saccharimonadales bacterium]
MRQIQQTVQQAIKDTENGYFPGAAGNDTAGTVLAGKRIYFCTDAPDRTMMKILDNHVRLEKA